MELSSPARARSAAGGAGRWSARSLAPARTGSYMGSVVGPGLGRLRWARPVAHAALLAAAAVPFLLAAALEMARGYRPASDDAVISFRAWQVWSLHPPLVGQYVLPTGHAPQAYDLGPGLYWLLSLPVHLDPSQGALWGAGLLCGLAAMLCVQAAWSARGPGAAAVVLTGLAVLVAARPLLATDPVWNPNFGLIWFVAAALAGWAVVSGRLGWWPVQVFAASLAVQCHVEYALGSVACCLLAPLLGLVRSRRIGRWLPVGLAVGLLCWLPTTLQQLTARRGNVSALLAESHQGAGMGAGFGWRLLASAVEPPTLWQHGNRLSDFRWVMGSIGSRPVFVGPVVIALLALATAVAWWKGRIELAALSAVTLVLAASVVVTFAVFPRSRLLAISYLVPISWPVGILVWAVVLWSLAELAGRAASKARARYLRLAPIGRLATAAGLVASLALTGGGASLLAVDAARGDYLVSGWRAVAQTTAVVSEIRCELRRGSLEVEGDASSHPLQVYAVLTGTIWQLYSDGWKPTTPPPIAQAFGYSVAAPRRPARLVLVPHLQSRAPQPTTSCPARSGSS